MLNFENISWDLIRHKNAVIFIVSSKIISHNTTQSLKRTHNRTPKQYFKHLYISRKKTQSSDNYNNKDCLKIADDQLILNFPSSIILLQHDSISYMISPALGWSYLREFYLMNSIYPVLDLIIQDSNNKS